MATLGAGASTLLSLAIGQKITFAAGGSGNAVLSGGQSAGTPYQLGNSVTTIGPFTRTQAISISAYQPISWQVSSGSSAPTLARNDYGDPAAVQDPDTGLRIPLQYRSNTYIRKTIGSVLDVSGTSTHQTRTYVPMAGMLADISMEFYNDSTSQAGTVVAHAIAGGNDYSQITPSGAWVTGATNLAIPVTALAARPTFFQTPALRTYLPADTLDSKWSTVYTRSQLTNGRIFGGAFTSTYDSVAGKHKTRLDFQAGLASITSVMDNPTANQAFRSSSLIVKPVGVLSSRTCVFIGDSRTAGNGSTSDQYGWAARAIEGIAAEFGDLIGYENWGVAGSTTADFLARFDAVVTGHGADLIYFQPSSTNNTNPFEEATITGLIATLASVAAECRRRGIAFMTSTQYPSIAVDSAAKLAQFERLNDHIRATYPGRYVEFYRTALTDRSGAFPALATAFAADTQHCNDAGHAIGDLQTRPVVKRLLGLSA